MIAYHADVALEGALHLLRHVVVTRKSLLQKFGPDLDQNESKEKLRRVDKKILVLYENTPTPKKLKQKFRNDFSLSQDSRSIRITARHSHGFALKFSLLRLIKS